MACERYVFDVIMRHAGAVMVEQVGLISMAFTGYGMIYAFWLEQGTLRRDLEPRLLTEGILAFAVQAMVPKFFAFHNSESLQDRLRSYLAVCLSPPANTAG